jgi:hypothetical protein|tara:strand:- start:485 stop:604 length:120 start_codon:yes stop_codon:yes gene_type:complete
MLANIEMEDRLATENFEDIPLSKDYSNLILKYLIQIKNI